MATAFHQRILALVRAQPLMVVELLAVVEPGLRALLLGGQWFARARDTNLRAIGLSEDDVDRLGDVVVTLHPADNPDGPPTIAVVVECQLRPDPEKLYSWVDYLAAVRREHRCMGRVLVLSPVDRVIPWAHRIFDAEPWLRPELVGREQMPWIADHGRALRQPELTVLSAVFHGPHEGGEQLVSATRLALRELPRYKRIEYLSLLGTVLSEDMMDEIQDSLFKEAQAAADEWFRGGSVFQRARREFLAIGREEGREEGLVQGRREGLALMLALRGLTPTPDQQARIDACADLSTLARWCERAKIVADSAALFD